VGELTPGLSCVQVRLFGFHAQVSEKCWVVVEFQPPWRMMRSFAVSNTMRDPTRTAGAGEGLSCVQVLAAAFHSHVSPRTAPLSLVPPKRRIRWRTGSYAMAAP